MANNAILYNAALAGAFGALNTSRNIQSAVSADYNTQAADALALAALVDSFIPFDSSVTQQNGAILQTLCSQILSGKGSAGVNAATARAIAAAYTAASALLTPAESPIAITIYGSGQDGIANFNGVNVFAFASLVGSVYTLTRDVFLSSADVQTGITLQSGGFKIFVSDTMEIHPGGIVAADGKDAALGVAGASSALGTLGIGTAGGNGRANNTGLPGTAQSNTLGDATAAGGPGGAGGANAGGLGGTYTPTFVNGGANFLTPLLTGFLFSQTSGGNQAQSSIIGGGAGGGGGGSDNAGVTGGGGGGGGGVLVLHALRLINNGIIRAKGGKGADASGAGGNAGGGGGGAGGVVLNLSRYRSGSGVVQAPGGLGGAKIGTGVVGTPGNDGHINAFAA